MEETDKIVIELQATGGDGADDGEADDLDNAEEKFNKMKKRATKAAVTAALGWGLQEASAAVMYNVGMYTNLSDDYRVGVALSNVSTTINKAKKLAAYSLTGAKLGSMIGGAPGAAIGTAIGVAADLASETFGLIRQYQQQDLGLLMNDRQAQFSYSRLGLTDNGRGTEN